MLYFPLSLGYSLLATLSWLLSLGLVANGGGVLDSQPCTVFGE